VLTGLSARLRPQLTSAYQSLAKEMAGQYLAGT
jgi:hypothetical protein